MRILCLYNNECAIELFDWIREKGHETVLRSEKLDVGWCREQAFDLAVSYTYRHILSKEVLNALGNNAVNIHNAYLPWNRGADPNLWSVAEGTPRGVTLHYMSAALDQGNIIAQQLVIDNEENETLSSTYSNLDKAAKHLFKNAFSYYEFWEEMRKVPLGRGSYHALSDAEMLKALFESYEIKAAELRCRYKKITDSAGIWGGTSEG